MLLLYQGMQLHTLAQGVTADTHCLLRGTTYSHITRHAHINIHLRFSLPKIYMKQWCLPKQVLSPPVCSPSFTGSLIVIAAADSASRAWTHNKALKIASCLVRHFSFFLFVFYAPSVSEAVPMVLNVCDARMWAQLLKTIQPARVSKVLYPHSSSGSVCVPVSLYVCVCWTHTVLWGWHNLI